VQLNNVINFCFDPRGRITRLPYLTAYVCCVTLLCLAFSLQKDFYYAVAEGVFENPLFINFFSLSLSGLYILSFVILVIITIKRFHDVKMNGFAILFLIVPFLNVYYQFVLFFRKGPEPFSETFLKEYEF
jgi:uncharacterized membrane protein YhaH (DUF805 family)